MSRRRSGLRKVNRLRRLLRRLPDDVTVEVRKVISDGSDMILKDAQANAPKRTGELVRRLKKRVARDGLTARVGLLHKRDKKKVFYAHWVEWGTVDTPAKPFLFPAAAANMKVIFFRSQNAIRRALQRAIRGAGNE